MAFKFEDLKVWKKALELSVSVHNVTLNFPKAELYILTSQIKRAADSVVLNIAEGSTGQSNPELNRFLGYALRSAIEVVSCIHIAKARKIIENKEFESLYNDYEVLIKMLQAFRNKVKIKLPPKKQ